MKISFISLLIVLFATALGQPPQSGISTKYAHKWLTIGDKVPSILVPGIINSDKSSVNLADFKDRLLIIDFWGTFCSSCVAALPGMQALQTQFGNKIKILPVTFEEKAMVTAFLKKNKGTRDVVIPTVTGDRILSSYFSYQYVCHEVWIYKGKVVALTYMDYVTADNIQFILDGKKNNWLVKDDFRPVFKLDKPLLELNENQYVDKVSPYYYEALFGYRENPPIGKMEGTVRDSIRHTRRDYFFNYPIKYAYYTLLVKANTPPGQKSTLPSPYPLRAIVETRNKSRFEEREESKDYEDIWFRKTHFCFEAVSADTGQTEQQQALKLIGDLDHLLGMHGRYETRKMKCLVLVRTSDVG